MIDQAQILEMMQQSMEQSALRESAQFVQEIIDRIKTQKETEKQINEKQKIVTIDN
ncbi:MAG: hypothetical protein LBQ50_06315 [Planctomycetaceae bacterium]|jgi:hypothetical protein|nr:hypothetical protein [Planctomycetaceae bacterium]